VFEPIVEWDTGMDTAMTSRVAVLFKNRRLIARILSLLLLLAQLGLEAHAYSHLTPEKHGSTSSIAFCGECLSHAPLTGMADAVPRLSVPIEAGCDVIASLPLTVFVARGSAAAFRSRAPPAVL
jgi:hypothetical protein